jgi:hypothetical protein
MVSTGIIQQFYFLWLVKPIVELSGILHLYNSLLQFSTVWSNHDTSQLILFSFENAFVNSLSSLKIEYEVDSPFKLHEMP